MVSSKDRLTNDNHPALGLQLFMIFTEFTDQEGDKIEARTAHFEYLAKLEEDGKVFAAGPLHSETGETTGNSLIAVKADNIEEARAIAEADPYYQAGFRSFTVRPWKINEGGFDLKLRFSAGVFELE
jgi:uncharacterized protein